MLKTILYVSTSTLEWPRDRDALDTLVRLAQRRNTDEGISGALLFTETHFAQFIEGPRVAINALMSRLKRDPRHREINVLENASATERAFDGWCLAYSGPAPLGDDRFWRPLRTPVGRSSPTSIYDLKSLMIGTMGQPGAEGRTLS